ncbi:hypothetical protein AAFF_G00275730 [Aldrovandia affinis]|uniref:Secreted protein n=1 Tax=Aldrovandia affinis TaxID=143900 RepID=A0AAD7RAP7_9TELE|nr:hypothetical protein AAFF_G00275730 [Aldrovandia affinis]
MTRGALASVVILFSIRVGGCEGEPMQWSSETGPVVSHQVWKHRLRWPSASACPQPRWSPHAGKDSSRNERLLRSAPLRKMSDVIDVGLSRRQQLVTRAFGGEETPADFRSVTLRQGQETRVLQRQRASCSVRTSKLSKVE